VPDLIGKDENLATTLLLLDSLIAGTITRVNSATVPAGQVISQNPAAGTKLTQGSFVDFVVSLGPAPVSVPQVTGLDENAATLLISSDGLTPGMIFRMNSDTVPAGQVISQSPVAGTQVAPGSLVGLTVSLGPTQVPVPDLIGKDENFAILLLQFGSLIPGTITRVNSDTVPAGQVISQDPAPGTQLTTGSFVDLTVSLGPAQVLGDIDGDSDVDRDDIAVILGARNQPASGPDDPRDLDGDGIITVLDARKAVLLCTRPGCAT
jgi:hypothetical protein